MPDLWPDFYFLRHGETDGNKQVLAIGQMDIPLNETGRQQAAVTAPKLQGQGITRIVSSPLSRARETAEIVNATLNLPLADHAGLMERSVGTWSGKPYADLCAAFGLTVEERRQIDFSQIEGAETFAQLRKRMCAAFAEVFQAYPQDTVLFVAHGGLFYELNRMLLAVEAISANAIPYKFAKVSNQWQIHTL